MTILLRAILDVPPTTTNHSYQIAGRGRRRIFKIASVQEYQKRCIFQLFQAEQDRARIAQLRVKPLPLSVAMRFYLPTLWRRDIDGMLKAPLDAIFSYLQLNDNRIVQLESSKHRALAAAWLDVQVDVVEEENSHHEVAQ